MKKTIQFAFSAFLTLVGLLSLPGYTGLQPDNYFPAPIDNPAISLYANFEISGIFNKNEKADQAVINLIDDLESLNMEDSDQASNRESFRDLAGKMLNERILNGLFSPFEAFLYVNDKNSFALIFHGSFDSEKIADLIGRDKVSIQGNKIHSMFRVPEKRLPDLFVQIDNNSLLICPDQIAPEVLSAINAQKSLLSERNSAFSKMMKIRPALACEAALESGQIEKDFVELEWLNPLKHFRLLVSHKMVKMQAIVPEENDRSKSLKAFSDFFSEKSSFITDEIKFTCRESENSIFVETEASLELEQLLSRKKIAFLLQFFIKPDNSSMQISSSNVYEQP